MKECTISVEQARQLSQTALDPKFASMVYVSHDPSDDKNYVLKCLPNDERGCWKIPAFTIGDMMKLLPKSIPDRKNRPNNDYRVDLIMEEDEKYKFSIRRAAGDCLCGTYTHDNFKDALFDIFLYCVNNRYLSKSYYKKEKETTNAKIRNYLTPVTNTLALIREYKKELSLTKVESVRKTKLLNSILEMEDSLDESIKKLIKLK